MGLFRADSDAARYYEGFNVLYGSNTFMIRITSQCVFGNLFPQVPATILSHITSVEFVMERLFRSWKENDALPATDKDEAEMLKRTLSSVPRLMPNLQKVYVGFCPETCLLDRCRHGNKLEYDCTKHIANLMGSMAREYGRMGRPCDLELGLPSTSFDEYLREAMKQGSKAGHPGWKPGMTSKLSYHPRYRIFRPALDESAKAETRNDEGRGPDVGYWVSQTQYDHPRPLVMRCFGT